MARKRKLFRKAYLNQSEGYGIFQDMYYLRKEQIKSSHSSQLMDQLTYG